MILSLEVVGISTISLVLEFSTFSGNRVVVPVIQGGSTSWRSVSLVGWLDTGESSRWTAETDGVVDCTIITIADTVICQSSDCFTGCVGSTVTLLDLVFDAELGVVAVQWAETVVQADQSVSGSEWRLVVGTSAFS